MATAKNNSDISFGSVTTGGQDATHWGLWTAPTAGVFIVGGTNSTNTPALASGQNFLVEDEDAIITVPASVSGRLSEAGARKILAGLVSGTTYMSMHSSDPGNTGANEISGDGISRVSVDSTAWTIA